MRIQNYRTNGLNVYQKQVEKLEPQKQPKKQEDKVEISAEAKELQKAKEMMAQRNEKIQQIKQQVESGSYVIDAKEVAKSMIHFFRKQ